MSEQIPSGRSDRIAYKWVALAVVLLADLAFGTTMTILGASLTTVAEDLDGDEALLAWTVSGPFLALAVGTSIFGKLGDLVGPRRVFRAGTVLFTVSTVASAFAPDAATLVALRAISGIGAAAALPAGNAIVLHAFDERERPRALGWFQMVATGGPAIGLITGGFLIDAFGWPIVFHIYGGISVVGMIGAFTLIRHVPGRPGEPLDVLGALLVVISTLALTIAVFSLESVGFAHPLPWALLAGAAVGILVFVRHERRIEHPLFPLESLRLPDVRGPLISGATMQGAYLGGLIVTPIILQDELGFSLSATAAMLLLRPAVFSITSPVSGRYVEKLGPRLVSLAGGFSITVSMTLFVIGAATGQLVFLLGGLMTAGASLGLALPAFGTAIADSLSADNFGVGSGMLGTANTLGSVIGLQFFLLALGGEDDRSYVWAYVPGLAMAAIATAAVWPMHKGLRQIGTHPT